MTVTRRSRQRGFSLVELLVALAIMALLIGVVTPNVLSRIRQGRGAALAQNLRAVTEAAWSFRGDMGRFPKRLVQLTTRPVGGDPDLCSRPISNVDSWKGPYLRQSVSAAGIVSGDAMIADTLVRNPPTLAGGTFATVSVNATSVDSVVAADLEVAFDGVPLNYSAGAIRWAPANDGTLSYTFSIRGC